MKKKFVYLDTDISLGTPGAEIDDGAALIAILGQPQIQIGGIGTVHGNVPVMDANHNLARLLSLMHTSHIPIGAGCSQPLIEDKSWFDEWQAQYGFTSNWPLAEDHMSSANLLIKLAHSSEQKINILAIGPLTNIAIAIRLDSSILQKIENVFAMGCSLGNNNRNAEFNIHCDPEAAQIVFSSGAPIVLFGLEITKQVVFLKSDFEHLPEDKAFLKLLKHQASGWITRVEKAGWEKGGCALHDAVAASAIVHPDFFHFKKINVAVELHNLKMRGITRTARIDEKSQMNIMAADDVDAEKCKNWIMSALINSSFE
jgi:inosine-uridine nucleoside N-ribohydrolase